MEPMANWSGFTGRHWDGGTTAAPRTPHLFALNESPNIPSRLWVQGWLEGVMEGGVVHQRTKDQSRLCSFEAVVPHWLLHPGPLGRPRWLLWWGASQETRQHTYIKTFKGFLQFGWQKKEFLVPYQLVWLGCSGLCFEIFTNFSSISQKHFSEVLFYFITSPTKVSFSPARQTQKTFSSLLAALIFDSMRL